ncbi:hypothetical protein Fot_32287 [Forsythia ovata]|uniref:Uncharacterized protein n=1 Tax=Forsythia ovata TaxID=205694 RepID=A0ABD1T7S5_9LAMI
MVTILTVLERDVAPPQLAVETQLVEYLSPLETAHPSHQPTSVNLEDLLNEKVEVKITSRKNIGQPIYIKEDLFSAEFMTIPLLPMFKEPSDKFDGTIDPIDHIRTFQDWIRLHGWSDTNVC